MIQVSDITRPLLAVSNKAAEARDAGIATEISDILTPERQEGLGHYEQILAFESDLEKNLELKDALMLPWKVEELPGLLDAHPEITEIFFESAQVGSLSFPKDWELGLVAPAIEYKIVNLLAQFAGRSATIAFDGGDRAEALRLIAAGVHFAVEMGDEPVTESINAWASSANRMTRTLYSFLERDPTDTATVDATLSAMRRLDYPQSLRTVLRGDILCYIVSARDFDEYNQLQIQSLRLGDPVKPPEGRRRPEAFETASIEFWVDALSQLDDSDVGRIEQGILIDRLGVEWVENETPAQYLSGVFPATYEQLATQIARSTQLQRLVYTAATIVAQWQASGELPDELQAQGDWTTDPVVGNEFYYERTESGFILQALGLSDPAFSLAPDVDLIWTAGQGYGLELTLPS